VTASVSGGLSPVRQVLPNGAVVIVQETAFSPAVTINFTFRAGSLDEPDDLTGLAWFLGRVIDRGTTRRSAETIAEALDDRGVALRATVNRHVVVLTCTCLSEDFAEVLDVLADVARNPAFPDQEIEKRRAEMITAIRQDLDNPGVSHEGQARTSRAALRGSARSPSRVAAVWGVCFCGRWSWPRAL